MAVVTFKGSKVETSGSIPEPGTQIPNLWVTSSDLNDVCLNTLTNNFLLINIVPSLDTGVCAASVREFDERIGTVSDLSVCTVSKDLPFALHRFMRDESILNIQLFSVLRDTSFGDTLGVTLTDGPLRGLLARTVVILDTNSRVVFSYLVPDLSQEPDYDYIMTSFHGLLTNSKSQAVV
jgi:thiol peroxidase